MNQQQDFLTLIFTDIVGSSQLYSSLGNSRAKLKIDSAIATMRQIAEQDGGRVIKTLGDEIMYSHPDPVCACATIIRMNQTLNDMHFYLRNGFCFGKVIVDKDDVYGDTVNNAAFLASTAQASQALLDAQTYSQIQSFRTQCEYFDRFKLKGQSTQSEVYRLNWEQHHTEALDTTVVLNQAISAASGLPTQVQVFYQGKTFSADPNSDLVIGRDQTMVDVCLQHKNASRKHCSIGYHRGKFVLRDQSTNGTYLQQDEHPEVFLRRESTPILGNGIISIGQPCEASDTLLEYRLD